MKCPDEVKIGAHNYSVIRKPAAEMEDKTNGKMMMYAEVDALAIFSRKRMPLSKRQEFLLHEILHICGHPAVQGDEDEKFVTVVAPVLLQVIRENPELIEFLRS